MGAGITYAFRDDYETYKDKKVSVRMPNDMYIRNGAEDLLSSPVITYKLSPEELAKYI